jgi:hypothetical protein
MAYVDLVKGVIHISLYRKIFYLYKTQSKENWVGKLSSKIFKDRPAQCQQIPNMSSHELYIKWKEIL